MKGVLLEGGDTHEAKDQDNSDPFGFGGNHRRFSHHSSDDAEKIGGEGTDKSPAETRAPGDE